jgi:hypothetical protein
MKPRRTSAKRPLPLIGWREWLQLPELQVDWIKAKIDSGAKTSTLHAFDLEYVDRSGKTYARFVIHPRQRIDTPNCICETEVVDFRVVRSSNGGQEKRPVIATSIVLLGQTWPIELTLTNRDQMGFRMLLGRQAIKNRFLVDAGRSYYSHPYPQTDRPTKRSNR